MTARTPGNGDHVSVIRGGTNPRCRYPVEAVVELFATVVFQDGPAPAAVVRVTRSAGLYRRGDLFVARVSELEPAGVTL
jgi:hypothetical protein